MLRFIVLVSCLLLASISQASTVKLNYGVLYGHMKTMAKLNYDLVTTAFYLMDTQSKQLCLIQDAQISVDKSSEPILFAEQGRLYPFYADQYRKDGAVINVQLDDNKAKSSCALQVVIMAKESQLASLNEDKLQAINTQLQGVVKKNAGMVGKHFLPEFAGLRIHFVNSVSAQQLQALNKLVTETKAHSVLVTPQQFAVINKINDLNLNVSRITPWLSNQ